MTLQELKTAIEQREFVPPKMLILVSENKFIPFQYIEELKLWGKYNISYVDSLQTDPIPDDDLFSDGVDDTTAEEILIYNTDVVEFTNVDIPNNLIVVAHKISKASKEHYKNDIIEIPPLADWQIRDMVYSLGQGIDRKHLDWLIDNCNVDVDRLYQEMSKIAMFSEVERKHLFEAMVSDGAYDDLSANTIFNFTNAVMRKDIPKLKDIYEEIYNIDINDFGLLTILYNNFLNLTHIQVGINPTPESLGMKLGQFNAIKYNCGKYNKTQLAGVLRMLSSIDSRVKMGELPTSIMRDYMILSILSA